MNYTLLPFRFEKLENEVLISNDVGEYCLLSNKEFMAFTNQELTINSSTYKELLSKQIISEGDDYVLDMLAIKYRTKKNFLENFSSLHMVVPTLRCNSNCSYCQVSKKNECENTFDMTKSTAKKVVDMIFKSPSQNIKIEFQGGDPLLNFKLVKYIIEYSEWKNIFSKKNLEFVICTNLTLITKTILKYLKGHKIYISTSIDGPKFLHDKNRPLQDDPESFDKVVSKIKLCREYLGENSVSALMTTTSISLPYYKEIIDTYIELGLSSIFLRPLNPYGFAKRDEHILAYKIENYLEYYLNGLDYIIQLNRKGIFFPEIFATILLTKLLTPFSTGFVDLQSPAGVGIAGVVYDYNGNVYVSDEGRMLAAVGDDFFCMGNVNSNSYQEIFNSDFLHNLIENSILDSLPGCSECAFIHYCGADPVRNYNQMKDIIGNRSNSEVCVKIKTLVKYLLNLLSTNDDELEQIFWSWILRKNLRNATI